MSAITVGSAGGQRCSGEVHPEDDYFQKGCGWLLKVAAVVHPEEVSGFLRTWQGDMKRHTFRYAIQKMDPADRAALMAFGHGTVR